MPEFSKSKKRAEKQAAEDFINAQLRKLREQKESDWDDE